MLGLNQRAELFRRLGQQGAAPLYSQEGRPFPCRAQWEHARDYGGTTGWGFSRIAAEHTARIRIFAPDMEACVGDKIVFSEGGEAIITEIQRLRGLGGAVHHLELLAVAEG